MVRRGRRFESVRGLICKREVAAKASFFVADQDPLDHLLDWEGLGATHLKSALCRTYSAQAAPVDVRAA
jgi:hypothetical protein